ncbi:MAG: undecaprenyl-diphosphate phosphatase, partial [Bdellovibrionaceae bacterium]|nr:undecaprenyl-diphosphate phosphatase [Pseudobdellovibrionaceae bacterium]
MDFSEALLLAVIEGITEFLPISSTGHMVIASALMGLHEDPFVKSFEVIIQFAAILSVVVLYRKRFLTSIMFYWRLALAFVPTAVIGFLLKDHVDRWLESVE